MQHIRAKVRHVRKNHQRFCRTNLDADDHERIVDKQMTFGKMDVPCKLYGALFFLDEKDHNASKKNPFFSLCCQRGKVKLHPVKAPPQELKDLLEKNNKDSKFYKHNIAFNSNLAYVSLQADIIDTGPGVRVFLMHGESYHRIGSLLPSYQPAHIDPQINNAVHRAASRAEGQPRFLAMYFNDPAHDGETEVINRARGSLNTARPQNIMLKLQNMMKETSIFYKELKANIENMKNDPDMKIEFSSKIESRQSHTRI